MKSPTRKSVSLNRVSNDTVLRVDGERSERNSHLLSFVSVTVKCCRNQFPRRLSFHDPLEDTFSRYPIDNFNCLLFRVAVGDF